MTHQTSIEKEFVDIRINATDPPNLEAEKIMLNLMKERAKLAKKIVKARKNRPSTFNLSS